MFSPSISAAAAEAHINDLLADAHTDRQARLARQADVARRTDRRQQPGFHPNRILVTGQATLAAVRSLVGTRAISRTAAVSTPAEADA